MIHAGENLFVVTGGPGAGKTTLLQAAAIAGYRTVPESGRAIITLQEAIGGRALHYADSAAYAELMLDRDMQNHQAHAASTELTLYDRVLRTWWVIAALSVSKMQSIFIEPRNCFATTARSFWRHPGVTSMSRTTSGGRSGARPCIPMNVSPMPIASSITT
ncbi:MAG: ATP-binding protein [Rhizobiaceae bacterium]|nr:ATP-binding protein [Rhizobiaceae bacterium]